MEQENERKADIGDGSPEPPDRMVRNTSTSKGGYRCGRLVEEDWRGSPRGATLEKCRILDALSLHTMEKFRNGLWRNVGSGL